MAASRLSLSAGASDSLGLSPGTCAVAAASSGVPDRGEPASDGEAPDGEPVARAAVFGPDIAAGRGPAICLSDGTGTSACSASASDGRAPAVASSIVTGAVCVSSAASAFGVAAGLASSTFASMADLSAGTGASA
ncbi:hypothetical protein [Nannocystis pusilla]|uniref:hypothetical protein n=1 Tax=Nannocystis pusilla TaxID=889268 RepID=UPI003B7A5EFE